MSGAKGAKLAARALHGAPRKHYCPVCLSESEETSPNTEMEAKPVMVFPRRRIFFDCKKGHRSRRGETILA